MLYLHGQSSTFEKGFLKKESEDKIEQYDNEVYNEEILISK